VVVSELVPTNRVVVSELVPTNRVVVNVDLITAQVKAVDVDLAIVLAKVEDFQIEDSKAIVETQMK
jgi:hypothetical protein